MDKEMLMKMLGSLSPEMLMDALSMKIKGGGAHSNGGPGGKDMSMFEPDPDNKVKGWSGISLVKGADDRPKLADKDYVIQKLGLGSGNEMPHDASGGGYARPF